MPFMCMRSPVWREPGQKHPRQNRTRVRIRRGEFFVCLFPAGRFMNRPYGKDRGCAEDSFAFLASPSGRGAPVRTRGRRGPGRKSLPLDKGRCPEGAEGSKSKGPIDPPPPSAEPPLRKGAFETVGADILHDEIPSANASPERALRPLRVEVPAGRRGLAEQGAHRRRTNPSVRPTARQLSFQGRQGTSTPQTHAENRRRRESAAVAVLLFTWRSRRLWSRAAGAP